MTHRMIALTALIAASAIVPAFGQNADLAFKPAADGWLSFDTGVVKGKLQADGKSQGMPTFIDVKTGTDLAYGGGNPGILSFYRLFSAGKRWFIENGGHTFREWPQTVKVLPDGAGQICWPAHKDHPVEMTVAYRWVSPTTLDVETVVKPEIDMPAFEVFLSSYFNNDFQSRVYLQPARYAGGKPSFLVPEGSPLVTGTYLAFPRDLHAARIVYDGRWEQGHSPVQWSITKYMAAPLALMRDAKHDITFVQMARPQDCFAVLMPYTLTPPDGVAGHRSIYLSLFGGDLKAGQTARALMRMVVDRGITDQKALDLYNAYIEETKGK
jgi:hypothetical protein